MKVIATALASAALVASVFALPAISSRNEQNKSIPARIRALERNVRVLKAQLASTRDTANSAQAVAQTAQTVADNLSFCLGRTLTVSSRSVDGIIFAPHELHFWSNPADGGAQVPSSFGGWGSGGVTFLSPGLWSGSPPNYVALVEPSCSNGFG
jgi:hypothetical protein